MRTTAPIPPKDDTIDLRDTAVTIRVGRLILVMATLLSRAAAGAYLVVTTPQYRANVAS